MPRKKLDFFSDSILRLRKEAGLTQETLAKMLGVSGNYIYMLEKGRPPGKKFVEKFRELQNAQINPEKPFFKQLTAMSEKQLEDRIQDTLYSTELTDEKKVLGMKLLWSELSSRKASTSEGPELRMERLEREMEELNRRLDSLQEN